jgi:hypothetical protein
MSRPSRPAVRHANAGGAADFRRPTLIGELSARLRLGLRRRRQHQRICENDDLAHAIRIDNHESRELEALFFDVYLAGRVASATGLTGGPLAGADDNQFLQDSFTPLP